MKRIRKKQKTIMTNDPSFRGWGWAILSYSGKLIAKGAIKTLNSPKKMKIRKGDDLIRRIDEIDNVLKCVIKKYNVNYMFAEIPHGSKNAAGAVSRGSVASILETISCFIGIGLEWYSEKEAKIALCGKGSLSKKQTIKKIDKLYDVKWQNVGWIDEAVADALAIHYVAMQKSSILKFIR